MSDAPIRHIGLIGFGEVGSIFGQDWVAAGIKVRAYDRLLGDSSSRERVIGKARQANVDVAASFEDAVLGAELVVAAVTASSAIDVARNCAPFLKPGQIYIDLNSVSPETKTQVSKEIASSGADFVEAAVLAAVKAPRLKVPIFLGGPRAQEVSRRFQALGMDAKAVSEKIGVASAIKMCRSVVMKGLAALAIESLFAARRYGAEEAVIASFEATYPGMGWAKALPDNLTRRAVEHSKRRAAEMRESAETIKGAGFEPRMSLATAELQDWLTAEMAANDYVYKESDPFSWQMIADMIVGAAKQNT
jgi:3-hydroxyisobutyrate dehydrogenase-like beta-hydroxyacid dehydrogenase